MKGFLITIGLVVASIIVAITQIDNIGARINEKALEIEGGEAGKAEFEKLKQDDPEKFKLKYREAFDLRITACKLTFFIGGEKTFQEFAEKNRELYLGTPLEKLDEFPVMLHRLCKMFEDRRPQDYYLRLVELNDRFPESSVKDDVSRELKLIKIRLNIA